MNYFSIKRKMMAGGGGGGIILLSVCYVTPFYKIQKPKTGLVSQKSSADYTCKTNFSSPEVLTAENF